MQTLQHKALIGSSWRQGGNIKGDCITNGEEVLDLIKDVLNIDPVILQYR